MDCVSRVQRFGTGDEDGEILQISEEVGRIGTEEVDHCLVGKILSGKRVNRDAFKSVIEHLWSPFGNVEVEAVVLEKPIGIGEISKLNFNKAEFWVQIHDIPIMCMNRRIAKWMVEQIGEVIEIPIELRDCWGKFLRVKVRIDISKPLKRWLRLSLDRSGNIVVTGELLRNGEEVLALEAGPVAIQGSKHSHTVLEPQKKAVEEHSKTLEAGKLKKQADLDRMCIDGPGIGPPEPTSNKIQKKWKRATRETQSKLAAGMMASPLQRKLASSMSAKKIVRRNSLFPSHTKSSPKNTYGRGKLKSENHTLVSHIPSSNLSVLPPQIRPQVCKKRINFDSLEEFKDNKKFKAAVSNNPPVISAKPVEQTHREP
ncbi:hypothetical protein EZV62_019622 [Acer yangbiense]|uniref:Uncharacterized protein n=1 Tax=Acer yangbiense TaxID=1000413 RepID=A0A5C7HDS7_9ROSI|nr:hypothetical protein EZV62_019622 [Acer yangbiense]